MTPAVETPWSTVRVDRVLGPFEAAGLLGRFEVQLAASVVRAAPGASDEELLALALVARATRLGHVCVRLEQVGRQIVAGRDDEGIPALPALPDVTAWSRALEDGVLAVGPDRAREAPLRPLVRDGDRLYLQRYWSFEVSVADQILARVGQADGAAEDGTGAAQVARALDALFAPGTDGEPDLQRLAAARALASPVSVLAGGPGTGKTHTVARIVAAAMMVAAERGEPFGVGLAAPTGKAAARMREALETRIDEMVSGSLVDAGTAERLAAVIPTTVHTLLGSRGRSGFRHGAADPMPYDLVVVDETSMVSLPLLARLLDALRPTARLVLVGDPSQLSSIEAGTVMADLAGPVAGTATGADRPLAGRVTELRTGHRFRTGSSTAALAQAVEEGDADEVVGLLGASDPEVHWVRPEDHGALAELRRQVVAAARDVVLAALAGSDRAAVEAAGRLKVLAAVRRGPNGLSEWSDVIADGVRNVLPVARRSGWPTLGMPVMVTGNDPVNRLVNGDVGVVVDRDGARRVAMGAAGALRMLAPARLGDWEPWWAMTIHKSQGSEFPHAVVSLPAADSPILTRELLYTAITRAKPEVTVLGSEEVVRLAVARPITRASGLRDRLWPDA